MSGERLQRAIDREILHAEPECADARSFAGRCLTKRKESWSSADAKQNGRTLTRLHRHSEQTLVELERSPDVGDRQRDLAEAVDAKSRPRRRLREQTRSESQGRKRCEKAAAID